MLLAMIFSSRHLVLFVVLLSGAVLPVLRAEPVFKENGVVIIPQSDFTKDDGKLSAHFKATRWGMYRMLADGKVGAGLQATINGESAKRGGTRSGDFGTFYLAKAGATAIEVAGAVDGVTALSLVPACEGTPVVQEDGKPIELDAKDCVVEGVMLRYEPNPKKLCLGFWGNPKDSPVWSFTVKTPGAYKVVLTQGCGRGAGGSEAVVQVGGAELPFTVQDTGGYQNWRARPLGKVTFAKPGEQRLRVRVTKKARGIMDIRRIVLRPIGSE